MKKLGLGLLALSLVGLTACSSKQEDKLETIKEKGEIVVAMEGTWAPWTYHDESGKLVGFDVEVAEAIAKELGVSVKFEEGEWDGLLAGLDANRYDMVVNGVEISEERAEKYDFSEPYGYIHTALIVRSDNNEIKSFEDLKGKQTANSVSSTYESIAESYGAKNNPVDSLDQTMDLVKDGRVDATLNAELSFDDYMKEKPNSPLKVVDLTREASHVAIPLVKGNDSFKNAVDNAIKKLKEDGTIGRISMKYFGKDISKKLKF